MGTTAVWALPYPADADVADVPLDLQELCDRLETVLSQLKTGSSIPGEIKMWSGSSLPAQANFGKWVWADGAAYATATYPIASGNINSAWKTFGGAADPGAGNFRVPDLRGLVPAGMDAMPGGSDSGRITRATAIATRTGEETHIVTTAEMPVHNHPNNVTIVNAAPYNHYHNATTSTVNASWVNYGGGGGYPLFNSVDSHAHTLSTGGELGGNAASIGGSIGNSGSGSAHENMQPTVWVPYIVRLDG